MAGASAASNGRSTAVQTSSKVVEDAEYSKFLLHNLQQEQKSQEFTDFTIKTKNGSIRVHKNILAAACPYFRALLHADMTEAQKNEISLNHIDSSIVQALVEYFYTGKLELKSDTVQGIVEACKYFQLSSLKEVCSNFIVNEVHIPVIECIKWCKFATLYNLSAVVEKTMGTIHSNFTELNHHTDFLDLSLAEVIDLVKDKHILVESEDPVLQSCIDWVMYQPDKRSEQFENLLQHLHLQFCTSTFLKHISNMHEELFAHSSVQSMLLSALMAKIPPVNQPTIFPRTSFDKKITTALVTVGGCTFRTEETLMIPVDDIENRLCWKLEKNSSAWEILNTIPESVCIRSASICQLPYGFVISGGYHRNTHLKTSYLFNLKKKEWLEMGPMNEGRYAHGSQLIGENIYIVGGFTSKAIDSVEMLDPKDHTWTVKKPLRHAVSHPITAAHGISVYVLLNTQPANETYQGARGISLQEYNTATNMCTFKSPMPDGCNTRGATAVTLNAFIYVFGGPGKLCTRYDINLDAWTLLQNCKNVHCYGSGVVRDGKILLLGGSTNAESLWYTMKDTIESYDTVKNEWSVCDLKLPTSLRLAKTMVMPIQK